MTNLEASIPKWQTRELPVSYDLEALLHGCNQLTSCRPADSNSVVIYGRTDPTTRVRVESKQTGLGGDIAARIQIIKDEFSMPFYAEYAKDDLWKHRSGIAETGDIARFVNDQFLNMAPYSRLLDINPSATSFHLATQDAFTTQKDLGVSLPFNTYPLTPSSTQAPPSILSYSKLSANISRRYVVTREMQTEVGDNSR